MTQLENITPYQEEQVAQYYVNYTINEKTLTFPSFENGRLDYEHFTCEQELASNELLENFYSTANSNRTVWKGTRKELALGKGRCACGRCVVLMHPCNLCECGKEYNRSGMLLSNRNDKTLSLKERERVAAEQYTHQSVYLQEAQDALSDVQEAIEEYKALYPDESYIETPARFDKYLRIALFDLTCIQEEIEKIVLDLPEERKEEEDMTTTTTTNEHPDDYRVTNIGDIVYGYAVNGLPYHPECTDNHNAPITYNLSGNDILNKICRNCDEPLVSYEEIEELWTSLDTYIPSYDDLDDLIADYAEQPGTSGTQVDGFRAGYNGYPEKRGMTPGTYALWTGLYEAYLPEWLQGYKDGVAQSKEDEN